MSTVRTSGPQESSWSRGPRSSEGSRSWKTSWTGCGSTSCLFPGLNSGVRGSVSMGSSSGSSGPDSWAALKHWAPGGSQETGPWRDGSSPRKGGQGLGDALRVPKLGTGHTCDKLPFSAACGGGRQSRPCTDCRIPRPPPRSPVALTSSWCGMPPCGRSSISCGSRGTAI